MALTMSLAWERDWKATNNKQTMEIVKYKHIIWDWNGTLFDDVNLCIEIINSMLVKRQLPEISFDEYRDIFSFPVINYYQKIGFDFELEPFESISTEFITQYEKMRVQCSLMSDALETLEQISRLTVTQSILSASKQSYLSKAVLDYGLDKTFVVVNGLDNHHATSKVELGKEFITNSMLDPSKILLIGDTTHDAEVAASIGADCCLIPNGHQSSERLMDCGVPVVESLSKLSL